MSVYFLLQNLASKETTKDNSEWKESCGQMSRSAWGGGGGGAQCGRTTWWQPGVPTILSTPHKGPAVSTAPGERAQPQSPSQSTVDEASRTKAVEFGTQ